MEALTVKQLRDALTKLMKENPKTENLMVVTADAEDYEHFTLPYDKFTCGNFTKYDNGDCFFLTEEDFDANENDLEYEENAVCISY